MASIERRLTRQAVRDRLAFFAARAVDVMVGLPRPVPRTQTAGESHRTDARTPDGKPDLGGTWKARRYFNNSRRTTGRSAHAPSQPR
jgi:hypothetical protein